jgi:hypothetical protein
MDNLFASGLLTIVKFFLLTLLFLFIIFSVVVFRQVQLMTRVLAVPISGSLKFVTWGLFVFAAGLFLFALASL